MDEPIRHQSGSRRIGQSWTAPRPSTWRPSQGLIQFLWVFLEPAPVGVLYDFYVAQLPGAHLIQLSSGDFVIKMHEAIAIPCEKVQGGRFVFGKNALGLKSYHDLFVFADPQGHTLWPRYGVQGQRALPGSGAHTTLPPRCCGGPQKRFGGHGAAGCESLEANQPPRLSDLPQPALR